jgi:hypothetical protein
MLRVCAALVMSVGLGLAVAGCYAFVFAVRLGTDYDAVTVSGFGPLNGVWTAPEYAFLGALLSSVGCGLFVLGLTWFLARGRPWRPLLWGLLTAAVAGGLAGYGAYWGTGRLSPPPLMSLEERDRAANAADDYLLGEPGSEDRITDDFRRRLRARGEQTVYSGRYSTSVRPVSADEVVISGSVTARQKTVRLSSMFGVGKMTVTLPEPQRLTVTLRLKKSPDGAWLVDDLEYKE